MSEDQPVEQAETPKRRPSKWVLAWLAWGALFLVIEGFALFNSEKGDTLSENLRKWGGIHTPERKGAQWAVFAAFLVFVVWFPIHILTGKI